MLFLPSRTISQHILSELRLLRQRWESITELYDAHHNLLGYYQLIGTCVSILAEVVENMKYTAEYPEIF